jgi:hypothetical protein
MTAHPIGTSSSISLHLNLSAVTMLVIIAFIPIHSTQTKKWLRLWSIHVSVRLWSLCYERHIVHSRWVPEQLLRHFSNANRVNVVDIGIVSCLFRIAK